MAPMQVASVGSPSKTPQFSAAVKKQHKLYTPGTFYVGLSFRNERTVNFQTFAAEDKRGEMLHNR